MKQYKKFKDNYVIIENDGEEPRLVNIGELQRELQATKNQKNKMKAREDILEEEIAAALLAIQNTSPN